MALHAKNIAMMTDAQGEEVEILVQRLVERGTIHIDVAEVELAKLPNKRLWAFLKNFGVMNSCRKIGLTQRVAKQQRIKFISSIILV